MAIKLSSFTDNSYYKLSIFSDDDIEDDFEDIEDRQSLADYYGWDDGRAGTNLFDVILNKYHFP